MKRRRYPLLLVVVGLALATAILSPGFYFFLLRGSSRASIRHPDSVAQGQESGSAEEIVRVEYADLWTNLAEKGYLPPEPLFAVQDESQVLRGAANTEAANGAALDGRTPSPEHWQDLFEAREFQGLASKYKRLESVIDHLTVCEKPLGDLQRRGFQFRMLKVSNITGGWNYLCDVESDYCSEDVESGAVSMHYLSDYEDLVKRRFGADIFHQFSEGVVGFGGGGKLFLDIGAHGGLHSLVASSYGYEVLAVEPLAGARSILEAVLCLNEYYRSRITILQDHGFSDTTYFCQPKLVLHAEGEQRCASCHYPYLDQRGEFESSYRQWSKRTGSQSDTQTVAPLDGPDPCYHSLTITQDLISFSVKDPLQFPIQVGFKAMDSFGFTNLGVVKIDAGIHTIEVLHGAVKTVLERRLRVEREKFVLPLGFVCVRVPPSQIVYVVEYFWNLGFRVWSCTFGQCPLDTPRDVDNLIARKKALIAGKNAVWVKSLRGGKNAEDRDEDLKELSRESRYIYLYALRLEWESSEVVVESFIRRLREEGLV